MFVFGAIYYLKAAIVIDSIMRLAVISLALIIILIIFKCDNFRDGRPSGAFQWYVHRNDSCSEIVHLLFIN